MKWRKFMGAFSGGVTSAMPIFTNNTPCQRNANVNAMPSARQSTTLPDATIASAR